MLRRRWLALLLVGLALAAGVERGRADIQHDLQTVRAQGRGTAAGRAAWERLASGGPELLPQVLAAMDTADVVAANWLRTAFDRILDRAQRDKSKGIDVAALLAFSRDAARQGRARRLALETVEQLRPGTTARLLPGWLEDREFRYEAVAALLDQSKALAKKGLRDRAGAGFRKALEASRDVDQGRAAAAGLLDLGIHASVAQHLGFLTDWYVIGPFDGFGQKGFHTTYPPEKAVDLAAVLDGKGGKVRWKHLQVKEPPPNMPTRFVALVDLRSKEALGDADDAVAFAWTAIRVPAERAVEFRGAADDNFTVWVNGQRVFGFEEYRNGVRHDRHRFPAQLKAGVNTVLVKVCQTPAPNPEPNWEFFLRIVDETGKGILFQYALPPTGK
jgi:hypothetical protein